MYLLCRGSFSNILLLLGSKIWFVLSWSSLKRGSLHWGSTVFSSLSPNINMHILLSVLHTFCMVLVERICTNIKTFHA